MVQVQAERGISLAILEHYIVTGPVALDEVRFENQRLFFGSRQDRLEIGDFRHQNIGFGISCRWPVEIG